jgi:hypothetical protein
MPGDDDERHLQREGDQFPEAASPCVDDLRQCRGRRRRTCDHDDERADDRENERVGNPALGPRGQRERQTRKACDVVAGDVVARDLVARDLVSYDRFSARSIARRGPRSGSGSTRLSLLNNMVSRDAAE